LAQVIWKAFKRLIISPSAPHLLLKALIVRLSAMIRYTTGGCIQPVAHIFTMQGSVVPKAAGWAFCSGCAAVFVNLMYFDEDNAEMMKRVATVWFSFSFLLSFLVVFRTQSAYNRYWEGASTLHSVKGDFVNAASCMFAFCSVDPAKKAEVRHFQHLIVRLLSLLHCSGLQSVASMNDEAFDVFELESFSVESIQHLNDNREDKTLIVLQWLQKTAVSNIHSGVLQIAPPIASRIFQQLGQGVMQLSAAQKIANIPFPFPYTQMVTLLLCGSTVVTPIITGLMIPQARWAGALSFVGIFGFWAINYIAAEIEMPFGDDKNDLPISDMQEDFNKSLMVLFLPLTQAPPPFSPPDSDTADADVLRVCKCSVGLEQRIVDESTGVVKGMKTGMKYMTTAIGKQAHHMVDVVGHHGRHSASKDDIQQGDSGKSIPSRPGTPGKSRNELVHYVDNYGDVHAAAHDYSHHEAGTQQLVILGMRIEALVEEVSKNVGDMTKSAAKLSTVLEKMSCRQYKHTL